MQSDMLAPWKERIKRDGNVIDDIVWASTGTRLEDRFYTVITRQLERLVLDVVVFTIREEEDKNK